MHQRFQPESKSEVAPSKKTRERVEGFCVIEKLFKKIFFAALPFIKFILAYHELCDKERFDYLVSLFYLTGKTTNKEVMRQ